MEDSGKNSDTSSTDEVTMLDSYSASLDINDDQKENTEEHELTACKECLPAKDRATTERDTVPMPIPCSNCNNFFLTWRCLCVI